MPSLKKITVEHGRALWRSEFVGSPFPSPQTEWFEIRTGRKVAGWFACRYQPARAGSEAVFTFEGVYVDPEFRGKKLQIAAHRLALARYRSPGSKRKILSKTYVSAINGASLKNCLDLGYRPTSTFADPENSVFVRLEGLL